MNNRGRRGSRPWHNRSGRDNFAPDSSDIQDSSASSSLGQDGSTATTRQFLQQHQRPQRSGTSQSPNVALSSEISRGQGSRFGDRGSGSGRYQHISRIQRDACIRTGSSDAAAGAGGSRQVTSRAEGGGQGEGAEDRGRGSLRGRQYQSTRATARTASSTGAIPRIPGGSRVPKKENITSSARNIIVKANFFAIDKFSMKRAFHYDVAITPETSRRLSRFVIEEFCRKHYPNRIVASDGKKNVYSVMPILNDHKDEICDSVEVLDEQRKRQKTFNVVLKYASTVDFTSLDKKCIQALDVVFRCAAAMKYVPIGRSHFSFHRPVIPLGGGFQLRSGIFLSVRLGQQLFVNADSVHKAFLTPQSVVDMIKDVTQSMDLTRPLSTFQISQIKNVLIGMKVKYSLPGYDVTVNSGRVYTVRDIVLPPSELHFHFNGVEITVENYYNLEKRVFLEYRNLPCLNLGLSTKPMYVPVELCCIIEGQAVNKKLSDTLNTAMIKQTTTSPSDKIKKIEEELTYLDLNNCQQIKEFGMNVNTEFQQVKACVLNAPAIMYSNDTSHPHNGEWRTQFHFFEATSLTKWTIFILDNCVTREDVSIFANLFESQAQNLGVTVSMKPYPFQSIDTRYSDLESCLGGCKEFDLIFVVSRKNSNHYSSIKKIAELKLGILTQHITSFTLKKATQCDRIIHNIVQKVNAKLGGINHTIRTTLLSKFFEKAIMYVGADVTHPPPGETKVPSVAAVCASYDKSGFKYRAQIRKQGKGNEILEDLEEIMIEHIKFYELKTGVKPQSIIFFRDGVSEGQFQDVKACELSAVQKACSRLNYKPAITLMVVQKRHHARFFPNEQDRYGKLCNVVPGTVIDNTITQPEEKEFYLVSHSSMRGTSRPCRYNCLWDDNDFSMNELQELAYSLCHMYSRCTRSVSYPTPTYYAHHAASRGKLYLSGQDPSQQPSNYLEKHSSSFQRLSPMHFV